MAIKYHKTPQGIKVCSANKRSCRYEDATPAEVLAHQNSGTSKSQPVKNQFPGIKIRRYQISKPYTDYNYDSYGCDGCHGCETGNDYCRGSYYKGLRVSPINADALLNQIFEKESNARYPQEFYTILENSGILDENNWEVEAEWDYYGETISGPTFQGENPYPKLIEYFSGKYNMELEDSNGYMSYIRELGFETTPGVSIDDSVKEYLMSLDLPASVKHRVQTSDTVTESHWRYIYTCIRMSSQVRIKARKENRLLTPREKEFETKIISNPEKLAESNSAPLPEIKTNGYFKTPILGILVKHKTNNTYYLATGHENYRTLSESAKKFRNKLPDAGLEKYRFIIVE